MATQDSGLNRDHDSVTSELETMRQIARALDALHDDETRQRVMQWVNDRYRAAAPTLTPQPVAVMREAAADAGLAVETLDDLFEPEAPVAASESRAAAPARAGVESLIKDFAADFRRFALEWQGA